MMARGLAGFGFSGGIQEAELDVFLWGREVLETTGHSRLVSFDFPASEPSGFGRGVAACGSFGGEDDA